MAAAVGAPLRQERLPPLEVPVSEASESTPELLLERYEVIEELGRGDGGVTYRVRDREQAGCELVAKWLALEVSDVGPARARFEEENATLERLHHPGLPRLVAAEAKATRGGLHLLQVREHISGESVRTKLARGHRFSEQELRPLLRGVLEIQAYLETRQPAALHGDIKPGNLVIGDDGSIHLVDFGAGLVAESLELLGAGTNGYRAPERRRGKPTSASDRFSIGATFAHLATRRHPASFTAASLGLAFADLAATGEPFNAVVTRLVAPKPDNRYASAQEALEALDGLPDFGAAAATEGAPSPATDGDTWESAWLSSQGEEAQPNWSPGGQAERRELHLTILLGVVIAAIVIAFTVFSIVHGEPSTGP